VVSSSPSGTSKSDASGDTDEASLGHTSAMAAASQATLDPPVRPPPVQHTHHVHLFSPGGKCASLILVLSVS
jgi:hypothetical protein